MRKANSGTAVRRARQEKKRREKQRQKKARIAKTQNQKSQNQKTRDKGPGRKPTNEERKAKLAEKSARLMGESVESIEYPGGASRRSFRVILKEGGPVIVSARPEFERAETERTVLTELASRGAQVPRLLASDGQKLLVQEEIPGERLSQAVYGQDESRVEQLLDEALTSLAGCHVAGSEAGFDTRLEALGETFEWLVGLLDRPAVIGNILDVPAPQPDLRELESLLALRNPRFIKWDSRPGNAMVTEEGKVFWFDWEHCGTRNRLDDVAWLLGDEFVPEYPDVEARLIEKHIASFADDLSVDEARQYLAAYGVFHLTVRLGLICQYKMEGDWWGPGYCLEGDKVGINWESLLRVCKRGERWAQQNACTEALAPWFIDIADHFEEQTLEESVHVR